MSGWDRHLAEYGDTIERSRLTPKRDCTVCGNPTTAISGICPDHQLSLFDTAKTTQSAPSSQIGPDDPWPDNFF